MGDVIQFSTNIFVERKRLLARAEKIRRIAGEVSSAANGYLLKACGFATRAGYVGFSINAPNTGAPEDAQRFCRAARRYFQASDRMLDLARRVEIRAGIKHQTRSRNPNGAA
jgi:hypothetical protein